MGRGQQHDMHTGRPCQNANGRDTLACHELYTEYHRNLNIEGYVWFKWGVS